MSIAATVITTAQIEQEVTDAFNTCDVHLIWLKVEALAHAATVTAMIWEQIEPLHKVAAKISGCFCRDYELQAIERSGNGYQLRLTKIDWMPAASA